MNIFNNNNYIIKNSSGENLRFYLDKNKKLNYDLYDNNRILIDQYLVSEDIINSFSLDIDNKDRVHFIYLTNEGNICYNLYSNKKWAKKTLTQFDMRSNCYSNLTLRVNKENIHILFSLSNLINPNVWTIQHLIGTKGNWEKTNIISFTSAKAIPTYSFDFDKFDNIHLVYTSIVDSIQKIYYVFFNASSKKWCQVPKLLSEHQGNSNYPSILVDKIDNIHIIWLSHEKNNYEVKYKHFSQLGSSRNTWKEETLPCLDNEYAYPIILEEKDCLQIILKESEKILFLASLDYGYSWRLSDTFYIPQDVEIKIAGYLTNFSTEKNILKMFQVLFFLDDMQILLKHDLMDYIKKCTLLNEKDNEEINVRTEELIHTIDTDDDRDFSFIDKKENINQTNEYYDNSNDIKSIIHSLSDISNDIKNIRDIGNNFISQFKDIDNTLLALKESIDTNNQCFIDIDKKINELNNKSLKKGFWSRFFNRS